MQNPASIHFFFFFFSSRRRHTRCLSDWSSDVCSSDLGSIGRHEEARQVWDEMLAINPQFSIERLQRTLPYRDPAWFERVVDGLRKAGIAPRDAGDVGTGR